MTVGPGRTAVRIEPVTVADVDRVIALAADIWYEHYPAMISRAQIGYMLGQRYDPALVRAELARGDVGWDKALIGDDLCGFSSYLPGDEPATMKLDKLYIRADRRRMGLGSRLVSRAVHVAGTRGCARLRLAVNKKNAIAIAAYTKLGFRVVQAVVKDIGGGFVMDDFIMEIPLS